MNKTSGIPPTRRIASQRVLEDSIFFGIYKAFKSGLFRFQNYRDRGGTICMGASGYQLFEGRPRIVTKGLKPLISRTLQVSEILPDFDDQ